MASFLHLRPLLGHGVTALLWGGDEAPSHRSRASGPPSNSRDSEAASRHTGPRYVHTMAPVSTSEALPVLSSPQVFRFP